MNFSEIVEHLGNRGFVTREIWNGNIIVFFGMDNSFLMSYAKEELVRDFSPHLVDITANDWKIIDCYWEGSDVSYYARDFKPFVLGLVKPVEYVEENKHIEETVKEI